MKVNHAAVWLLVFVQLVLLVIWRSPLLFYNVLMDEQGRRSNNIPKEDNLPFVSVVIAIIVMTYFLSWLVQSLNKTSMKSGLLLGLLVSFGFTLPVLAINYKLLDVSNLVLVIDLGMMVLFVTLSSTVLSYWNGKVKE